MNHLITVYSTPLDYARTSKIHTYSHFHIEISTRYFFTLAEGQTEVPPSKVCSITFGDIPRDVERIEVGQQG